MRKSVIFLILFLSIIATNLHIVSAEDTEVPTVSQIPDVNNGDNGVGTTGATSDNSTGVNIPLGNENQTFHDGQTDGYMAVDASLASSYTVAIPAKVTLEADSILGNGHITASGLYNCAVKGNITPAQYVSVVPDSSFTMEGTDTGESSTAYVSQGSTKWYHSNAYNSASDKASEKEISKADYVSGTGSISVELPGLDEYRGLENFTYSLVDIPELMTYNVHFNANGGSGEMSDQTMQYDVSETLSENEFTGESATVKLIADDGVISGTDTFTGSKSFLGWAVSETGDTVYTDKQSVTNIDDDEGEVTLYAKWSSDFGKITLPSAYKDGMDFLGWSATYNSEIAEIPAGEYTVTRSRLLYAIFKDSGYTVNFNPNGGTGVMSSQLIPYGESTQLSACEFTGEALTLTLDPNGGNLSSSNK